MCVTRTVRRLTLLLGFLVVAIPRSAAGQSAANVLLVINADSPASVEIGEYYANVRTLPEQNIVRLNTPVKDVISRAEFDRTIQAPVAQWLQNHDLQDQILYIVLTKGVALRVNGTGGLDGTVASVDSELTLLYQRMVGADPPTLGRFPNPYYLGDAPVKEAKPFTREDSDLYLVTRLDAFTVEEARALIDRASRPSREGRFVLDQRATFVDRGGDRWLQDAADRLDAAGAGDRVVLENTRAVASVQGPVLGYYSWGSNDPSNQQRDFGLQFANGAIAGLFVSTDGRTFTAPPDDWRPGAGMLAAYGTQSLAGDLIREGVTGVSAHVTEPLLDATIRPQILFPAYAAGFNLAEAYYLAMPFLSWQTVIIGDPLCAPFRERVLPASELYEAVNPATETPAIFGRRWVDARAGTYNREALEFLLRAEVHDRRDDTAGLEPLLVKAVELEPRLLTARLRLASLLEAREDWDAAIAQYRAIVDQDPRNAVALNNLAYALAERKGQPKEAWPFAERAVALLPAANVLDTAGWIQHLMGDEAAAARYLERALTVAPGLVEALVHAAEVHLALGNPARARRELEKAEQQDPTVAERADVQDLKRRIGGDPWGGPVHQMP